ncbi:MULTISPECIES: pitrilysin family protein [unclassified Tatumella]|uniref:insulinase family protein n=1 Tax=unclassified Tatumella TaxID=2649542 RepID=UPI001BB0950D|nr:MULTISPECIES: pitrilysin family protein [unclassified Tatumella]MBS0878878.1 insulinase family protein [Tatumella sp. JGM82]MBS0892350.1 insulinase family protein [Tatumella sp. JGM94]MBS0903439.1 insulinase family protein [Tatumella sp. JGM100]
MQGTKFMRWMGGVLLVAVSFTLHAEALQPDPAWQQGKLKNGFNWQVLATPQRPSDSIELRLVVESGSLNESPLQTGYSHLLTRLALVHNSAISVTQQRQLWQQSIDKRNALPPAVTSYDFTRYNLSLPANRPDLIKDALLWLSATAGDMAITPQIVNSALAASDPTATWPANTADVWWRYRLQGSALLSHDPQENSAQPVDIAQLTDFYHTWYTPDAMTLYVVGNVDSRAISEQISKAFSSLKGQRSSPPSLAVLPPLSYRAVNLTDSQGSGDRLSLIWDMPWSPITDSQSLQQYWLSDLAREVLYWHLLPADAEKASADTRFGLDCRVFYQRAQCGLNIDTTADKLAAQSDKVASDFAELRDNGLTQQEFDTLMSGKLAELNSLFATYARTGTSTLMAQRLRSQQNAVVDISPEQYQRLRQAFLAGLTLEALNHELHQQLSQPVAMALVQPQGEAEIPVNDLKARFDKITALAPVTEDSEQGTAVPESNP